MTVASIVLTRRFGCFSTASQYARGGGNGHEWGYVLHLLGFNVATIFHQDDEAVLRILASGYSAKLRHCGRVRCINVAAMSEQLASECTTAEYCNTLEQIANGCVKVIAPADWGHMQQQLGMQSVGALAARPANTDKAEAFAGTEPRCLTNQHVVQLLSLLPRDPVSRGDPNAEQAHAFTVGAFVHGGVVGIRDRTFQFPQVAALLCRLVQQFKVAHPFTTISLFQGVDASLHRDSHNHPSVPNLLVQLSPGEGPILWVVSPDGTVSCPKEQWDLKGHLLNSPALFDARRWHCSIVNQDLAKRIVIVAYSIRNAERLAAEHYHYLRKLGFQLA